MKLPLTFLVLFSLSFCSCRKNQSQIEIIPEEQFINFYSDLLIVREESILLRLDSLSLQHRIDSLYQKYQLDTSKVRITLENYKQDLDRWKEFHGRVTKRLEVIQREELSKPKL